MGFIPFSYWGAASNDLLPSSSLVFYYNANDQNSYDITYTGSATNTSTGIINLANAGTNLGIVFNASGSYNDVYYGINTLNGRIDNNIPLILYDTGTQGTVLVKGYMAPFLNAQDKYLLRNPTNSNEGIRAFGTVNTTTKGKFTFSRGVTDADGVPTSSMYITEGYGTVAITKQVGDNFAAMSVSNDGFATKYTANVLINDFDYIFEKLGYFQAAAYWSRKLSDSELISASLAFNTNGKPQGYNATTASAISSPVSWFGGTTGTTAYYLEPNQTTLTRRLIAIGETFYDCVCNTGSRLDTGGTAITTSVYPGPCQVSASTTYPTVEYLLLGGGGGGGFGFNTSSGGGGGAGGGFISGSVTLSTGTSYPITIGAGGRGATPPSTGSLNGGNTTAFGLTAFGGGGGGSAASTIRDGFDGGCGGGSAYTSSYNATGSQGGNGGRSFISVSNPAAGGGGGAAASGANAVLRASGNGGNGKAWLELNTTYRGAGGGGGGTRSGSFFENETQPGDPGLGGTGAGGTSTRAGVSGTANKGDGGGGGYSNYTPNQNGGTGGSGLVAIRYNGTPQFSQGTIEQYLGMTYHYFTSSFTLNT